MATLKTPTDEPSATALTRMDKRRLAGLGVPTFALALSITVVSTYLPPVASDFTHSSAIIGLLIGGEGVMALFIPIVVGSWSDRLETRFGGRLPFLIASTPVLAAALVLLAIVHSLVGLGVAVGIFFAAYFVAYEPYRALYADLFPPEVAGRAQATQAIWRGGGTLVALASGGLLLSLSRALPFVGAAAVSLVAIGGFAFIAVRARRNNPVERQLAPESTLRESIVRLLQLLRERRAVRALLLANSLWELSLAALKTFVVLYITVGLGYKLDTASLSIGGVALVILAAAAVSGALGDRFGKRRVMAVSLWVYGAGLLVPFFTKTLWLLVPALPLIAFGGGVVMSLPYALLIPMMPEDEHGALTGLYSMSRGVGVTLGPVLGGIAIDAMKHGAGGAHGYQAMWLVCALAVALSIPLLNVTRVEERAERRR